METRAKPFGFTWSSFQVKSNNPLMGTETYLRGLQHRLPPYPLLN